MNSLPCSIQRHPVGVLWARDSRETTPEKTVGTHKSYGHGLALCLGAFFNETEDKLPRRPRVKSDVGYEKQENAPVVCQGRKSVETP